MQILAKGWQSKTWEHEITC